MKKCPNCGSEEFFVTAHVTQDWLVDKDGEFVQVENDCVEVTHQPKDDDLWICADCGYDAAGEKFEVKEETTYCVDLRDKLTHETYMTIFKSDSHDEAWDVANNYNEIHGNTGNEIEMLNNEDTEGWTSHPYWATVYDDYSEVIEPTKKNFKEMKKYALKDWEKFCKEALICPPFEDEENWQKWIDEHKIQIIANGCEMVLDYDADAINEIEFSLREIHNAIYGDGTATTGNTVGSEYRNATWKDVLRFVVLDGWYEDSHCLEAEIDKCICRFNRDDFKRVMQKIENQTSINDELEVNFFKLETKDLWKIFDEEERKQAFKEILCSKVEISELMDKDGKHYDQTVIMDYSIMPSGDLVGWHYGVDFDKNSEDNQMYIQSYIERMTK